MINLYQTVADAPGLLIAIGKHFPKVGTERFTPHDLHRMMNFAHINLAAQDYKTYAEAFDRTAVRINNFLMNNCNLDAAPEQWELIAQTDIPILAAAIDTERKLFASLDRRLMTDIRITSLTPYLLRKDKKRSLHSMEIFSMRRAKATAYSQGRVVKSLLKAMSSFDEKTFSISDNVTVLKPNSRMYLPSQFTGDM